MSLMVEDRLVVSERAYAEALIAGHGARQAGVGIPGFLKRRRELTPAELLQRREAALASARKRRKMRQSGIRKARRRLADMQRAETNARAKAQRKDAWKQLRHSARHATEHTLVGEGPFAMIVPEEYGPISGDVRTSYNPNVPVPPERLRAMRKAAEKRAFERLKWSRPRTAGVGRPSPLSTPKEIAGSHAHHPHGPSIRWPALYEHLRAKGMTKAKAAQISNGMWRKKHGLPPKSVPGTKGLVGIGKVA